MKEKIKNERLIPIKNYFIAGGVIIAVILLTWYGLAWYKVYKENKVQESYLMKESVISKEITDLEEIADVFSEVSDEYFVYVSYTGDEDVYNMEKSLAKVIKKYDISEDFYYLNVTSIKDEENYIDKVNSALKLKDVKIVQVPTIIYFKDGEVLKDGIITRKDNNMMTADDFKILLDKNLMKE